MLLSRLRADPALEDAADLVVVQSCAGKEKLVERLARAVASRGGGLRVAVLEASRTAATKVCDAFGGVPSSSVCACVEDPLDAAGLLERYSDDRRAWAAMWRTFPLYSNKATLTALVGAFRDRQVTLVISGTGSGKTVIAPPLMLHVLGPLKSVAVTIPKRATVLAAARTACRTLDAGDLGGLVGYSFRGEERASEGTRLMYMTDGMLLAKSRSGLGAYDAVILDEAHERSVATDFLLEALRAHAVARPDFRVVIMSATIDPGVFVSYFGSLCDVEVVSVAGQQMHPVRRSFLPSSSADYVARGVEVVKEARRRGAGGNVLFFVPLVADTAKACKLLGEKRCVQLYGKMSQEEREEVLAASGGKVFFVATNVAESSLTFPSLTDVVDSGLQMTSRWNARQRCQVLSIEMASRAQITQRIGRVGRTAPGNAHLLYSERAFDALPEFPAPAIMGVDLTEHVLSELAAGGGGERGSPQWFASQLISPPSSDQIIDAFRYLRFYGLIRGSPPRVSIFGDRVLRTSIRLKLSVPNALLVVLGAVHGVAEPAARLATILELFVGADLDALLGKKDGDDFPHQELLDAFAAADDEDAHEPWTAAREALASRSWTEVVARLQDDRERLRKMCKELFRPRAGREGSLRDAVVAARLYNLIRCDRKKRTAVTMLALSSSEGATPYKGDFAVFEYFTRSSGAKRGAFRLTVPVPSSSPELLSALANHPS